MIRLPDKALKGSFPPIVTPFKIIARVPIHTSLPMQISFAVS